MPMHLLLLACIWGLAPPTSSLKLLSVSLQDLAEPQGGLLAQLQDAVSQVGMFAVSMPGLAAEQAAALQGLVQCTQVGAARAHMQDVVLKDQTVRTTIATAANASQLLPLPAELVDLCPGFVGASHALRARAASVGHAYASLLDRLGSGPGDVAEQYQAAAKHAESLEHFHVYRQAAERTAAPALSMHKDLGMFLIMTPPQYYELATHAASSEQPPSGFRLRLPDGQVVAPEYPAGSLLVMNGEGAVHWVASPAAAQLYVPPHEVVMPEAVGLGRAWYGRMFLPQRSARSHSGLLTFNQYWSEGMAAVVRAPGEEDAHRMLLSQGNCSAGQLYCWMKCMDTAGLGCQPSQMVCTDQNGAAWPEQFINASTGQAGHCFNCTLRCPKAGLSLLVPRLLVATLTLLVVVLQA